MKFKNLLLMALLFCSTQAISAEQTASQFREGSHYMRVNPVQPTQSKAGRIEILVFFLYSCPHCYELEPKLKKWVGKYDNVDYREIPAIAGPSWAEMAKFYYTAEKLGVLDTLHKKFYDDIHLRGKKYYSQESIMLFFMRNGISKAQYQNAYLSPDVIEKASQARIATVKYGLRGVPVVIVNGKYKTAPFYVKDQQQLLQLLDELVIKETAALKKGKAG